MAAQESGFTRLSDDHMAGVIRHSDEWGFIEYLLQMEARTSRIKLLQAWHLPSSLLVTQFEKRTAVSDTQGSMRDYCFEGSWCTPLSTPPCLTKTIPSKTLPDAASKLARVGIPLLRGGLEGAPDPFALPSCVGHSVVMSDEREASGERTTLPPEYDSAYLQKGDAAPTETLTVFFESPEQYLAEGVSSIRKPEAVRQNSRGLSMATAGVLPQYTFRQEYVVYDSSQVVPNYLVIFEVDPTEPELFAVPLCDNCQDFPAAIWCPADTAKLCEGCDERLHTTNQLVSRHIRVPLNEVSHKQA
ncbi:b-box zinc finger family related protein [Cyclospora cayetanensis]|uniref:B-box zinc finger family related protein n=1 Tax=Cyclospora cayetanensis TaxID=88456 RepID=A0A1D3D8T4_9EIME|nr:b-box zinc finger family related protein [Cyclospora cayetanensis]